MTARALGGKVPNLLQASTSNRLTHFYPPLVSCVICAKSPVTDFPKEPNTIDPRSASTVVPIFSKPSQHTYSGTKNYAHPNRGYHLAI